MKRLRKFLSRLALALAIPWMKPEIGDQAPRNEESSALVSKRFEAFFVSAEIAFGGYSFISQMQTMRSVAENSITSLRRLLRPWKSNRRQVIEGEILAIMRSAKLLQRLMLKQIQRLSGEQITPSDVASTITRLPSLGGMVRAMLRANRNVAKIAHEMECVIQKQYGENADFARNMVNNDALRHIMLVALQRIETALAQLIADCAQIEALRNTKRATVKSSEKFADPIRQKATAQGKGPDFAHQDDISLHDMRPKTDHTV